MTSVSLLVWKIDPRRTSSSRSSGALTRLPLWQSAICPCEHSIRIGCALTIRLSPKVEYRTCPMAARPDSPWRTSSSNTSLTCPMARDSCTRPSRTEAMPALSWPRCCSAYNPR